MGRAKLTIAIALVASLAHAQVQVWNQDLTGSTNANKIVSGLKNNQLPSLTTGFLNWNGTAWALSTIIANGPGTAGQFLVTNAGATAPVWVSLSTDIAGSTSTPGSLSVQSITPTGGTSTIVPFNAGGFKLSTSPWVLQDSGAVQRFSLETAHGRGTFGGGGSDKLAVLGPLSGSETTYAALQLGSGQYSMRSDGSSLLDFNFPAASGTYRFLFAGSEYASIGTTGSTSVLTLGYNSTSPQIQSDTAATSLGIGTNKIAATTIFQSDAAQTTLTLDWANLLATFASTVSVKITAAHEDISQASAPGAPASGTQRIYTDSADGKLKVIDNAGNITTLGM